MLFLNDQDICRVVTPEVAHAAVRDALLARAAGQASSVPRTGVSVGAASLVWTPGGYQDIGVVGLRLYVRGGEAHHDDQLNALWNTDGELLALATGASLGRFRTSAIGGNAIAALARADAAVMGVIGFGFQAWGQVEAARVVRPLRQVLVYRRDSAQLRAWAEKARAAWGLDVVAVDAPADAVRTADIVVTATTAAQPVLNPAWLKPGTHVNVLGPKLRDRHEMGVDLAERADLLVADVPEQHRSDPAFILQGTPWLEQLEDLADVVSRPPARGAEAVTVFLSHGLPGTEVRLLWEAWQRANAAGIGRRLDRPLP